MCHHRVPLTTRSPGSAVNQLAHDRDVPLMGALKGNIHTCNVTARNFSNHIHSFERRYLLFFFSFNSPFFRLDEILVRALISPAAAYLAPIDSASYQAALIFGLSNIAAISQVYTCTYPVYAREALAGNNSRREERRRKDAVIGSWGKYRTRIKIFFVSKGEPADRLLN